ncbi:hypothetical protein L226DRAFT_470630 [Lentinus tigrinus ALCF2SS1-7]|uniref:Uncharacterized protein n=1 Tax=Lentinus tigrinus ALCF2SS1-6 TaxID=1328759 RepID=A0A5C2RUD5_9APHY|nr:hypothetical protein L227DRAFT_533556 [Lentinus tigrinus ALCF2SS1-6]RPD70132.1 hypothetical protein L226DRAFT_470630 [Lentinus tigrinus ALCF2SS1-7]
MVLHRQLACRDMTRDIDYIHRSFEAEWKARSLSDAGPRLRTCIKATAQAWGLGTDWMNACADVALPISRDTFGKPFDPISYDALSPNNVEKNTIFKSKNGMLVLVGVSWGWAVALKLVRYEKHDPYDIASILRLGHQQRKVKWTRTLLEQWLRQMCIAMNYDSYTPYQMETTRQRMRHAIALAYEQHVYLLQHQSHVNAVSS